MDEPEPNFYNRRGKLLKFASPFHSYLSIVFGTVVIFVVGFLAGTVIFNKK
jgi:SSS family solute:Na+ symporter